MGSEMCIRDRLFTDAGFGTLVKAGHQINKLKSLNNDQINVLVSILESAFKGTLSKNYFENDNKEFYISECNRSSIVITSFQDIAYMISLLLLIQQEERVLETLCGIKCFLNIRKSFGDQEQVMQSIIFIKTSVMAFKNLMSGIFFGLVLMT